MQTDGMRWKGHYAHSESLVKWQTMLLPKKVAQGIHFACEASAESRKGVQRIRVDRIVDAQVHTHVVTQPTIRDLRRQPGVVREDVSHVDENDLREFVASESEFFSVWRCRAWA
jgi:hypothetical protein